MENLWILPQVSSDSSHVLSLFGEAPVLTVSRCWQAHGTEGFWALDWKREFSETDHQFAEGGRAAGISLALGCLCSYCLLLVSAHLENAGSAGGFARWKAWYAAGLSCVHSWEVRALTTRDPSAPFWKARFLCHLLICFWKGAGHRGIYLLCLPYGFCTRGELADCRNNSEGSMASSHLSWIRKEVLYIHYLWSSQNLWNVSIIIPILWNGKLSSEGFRKLPTNFQEVEDSNSCLSDSTPELSFWQPKATSAGERDGGLNRTAQSSPPRLPQLCR